MPEIESENYHDFVIRDGRLIGEFDQMYRKSRDVPWHQDKNPNRLDCAIAADIAVHHSPEGSAIAEVGCGLGYLADMIFTRCSKNNIVGFDVSESAILAAGQRFPRLAFHTLDITQPLPPGQSAQFATAVMRGCLWYVYKQVDTVFRNLNQLLEPGGTLVIAQNFYPAGQAFVGSDVFPTMDALAHYVEQKIDVHTSNRLRIRTAQSVEDWIIIAGST